MLKGKNGIIIVVLVNIVVWSFFSYRLYAAFHEDEDMEVGEIKMSKGKIATSDTAVYKLSLNYEDPFLKKEAKKIAVVASVKTVDSKPKKIEKEPVKLPEIKYLGLVKNSSSGAATAIISINGQSKLVKSNETIEGILIKSFDATELVAMVGKEKVVVKK